MMTNIYYRGQKVFLYAKFKNQDNISIDVDNPTVSIKYEKNNEIAVLFSSAMKKISVGEYFENFTLNNVDYTFYEVEYKGEYEGKEIKISETFHVIPKSEKYSNTIKIYGFTNQSRLGYPLIGVNVRIELIDKSKIVYECFTDFDGKWNAYVYPGMYRFHFGKFGFSTFSVEAQIGSEHTEIQFDNITLESEDFIQKGNGIFTVADKCITKEGVPLNNLSVKVFDIQDPTTEIAKDITNEKGEWLLFLDPNLYFLKIQGNSLLEDFEQLFRLRVNDDSTFNLESLTENVAVTGVDYQFVDQGNGSVTVTDVILDSKGNPIVDVQICVYDKTDMNKLIAQDYTNVKGEWTVYLNPSSYSFEFYHPEFNEFVETRIIT